MTYVWRGGAWRDKQTGKRMAITAGVAAIVMPHVQSDIPEYPSPINGRPITSRSHRRDDMQRNGCIDYRELQSPTRGLFKNKRFCEKRGFQVSDEYR